MTTLKVEGMHCGKCVQRIQKALGEANIDHTVSLENHTVMVEGDESSVQTAINELEDLGFEACTEYGNLT